MRPPLSLTAAITSLAVASAVLTGAGSASAADFVIDLPAGAACADFGVRVEGIVGRNHTRTFVDENGNPVPFTLNVLNLGSLEVEIDKRVE